MEGQVRTDGLWLRSNHYHRVAPTCKSALVCCHPASKVYNLLSPFVVGILRLTMFLPVFSYPPGLWAFLLVHIEGIPLPLSLSQSSAKCMHQIRSFNASWGMLSFTGPTASKYSVVEYISRIDLLPQSMFAILIP